MLSDIFKRFINLLFSVINLVKDRYNVILGRFLIKKTPAHYLYYGFIFFIE